MLICLPDGVASIFDSFVEGARTLLPLDPELNPLEGAQSVGFLHATTGWDVRLACCPLFVEKTLQAVGLLACH